MPERGEGRGHQEGAVPEVSLLCKRALYRKYPFFDGNALDAGRFMFGSAVSEDEVFWHEGFLTVDEIITDLDYAPEDDDTAPASGGSIMEGARNNTMSHFAGRVLKKYGVCDKAHDLFLERGAISQEQYDKSLGELTKRLGMENAE